MSGLFPDGPVDLLRDQVRRVVFRVYQQSATPISTLMIQDLTEEEAIQILIDYHTACDTCDGLQARTDWSRTEEYKQISPHFAKLWDIVEQYRQKYAERLREANLVDVHIEYEYGTYNPPVFREDAAHIMNSVSKVPCCVLWVRADVNHREEGYTTCGLTTRTTYRMRLPKPWDFAPS